MATIKELKTTVKLRYDELDEWVSQNPLPDPGEVCVVVIPVGAPSQYDSTIGQYYKNDQLFSYSIGFKVGDGINHFNTLPWIQAAAGDVYPWAKQSEPPNASHLNATYDNQTTTIQAVINSLTNILANLQGEDIAVTYNNQDSDVQTAIASIEESIGGIVAANISPEALSDALNQLQEQLSDQSGDIFIANQEGVTYKIDTLTRQGLNITATSSPLTVSDISDLSFNRQYNQSTNPAATMGDLTALRTDILNSIPTAMRFRGTSTTEITDGGNENPTIDGIEITSIHEGDVVLYNNKEYIWIGTVWEVLGDESTSLDSLDPIAFDGNVAHLKQTDTILVFDCGNASDRLYE